ncbi:MAG: L,D-transpeptidase [Chthoniobacterales bacterium]
MKRLFLLGVFAGFLTTFGGCDTMSEMVTSNLPQTHTGRASLVVSLRAQEAYLYRGGQLVATSRISSGREGHRSPLGRFHVTRKDIDHRSSLYGAYVDDSNRLIKGDVDTRRDQKPRHAHFVGAPMPYFMEFSPGYGLHQGYLPGEPASHGCIRMPYWKARQFYDAVKVGTPVTVKS